MAFPKDPTSPLAFISKHAYTCTHTHIKSSKKPKEARMRDCLSKVMQMKKKYLKTNVFKNEQAKFFTMLKQFFIRRLILKYFKNFFMQKEMVSVEKYGPASTNNNVFLY